MERIHHVESSFLDPLSGERYETPFFFPNDGPVINTSFGITQSYNSTYCNRFCDGVTKDEVIFNKEMWPSRSILPLNLDKGYCQKKWEENLQYLKTLDRPFTPRDCQNIARRNETCVIGPPLGPCSLYYTSPLHHDFRQVQSYIQYVSLLRNITKNTPFSDSNEKLKERANTNLQLILSSKTSPIPIVSLRGDVLPPIISVLKPWTRDVVDFSQISKAAQEGLDTMVLCISVNNKLTHIYMTKLESWINQKF